VFGKKDLQNTVYRALLELDGSATIVEVASHIYENNKNEIQGSKIEFTWQYDMRWQATALRKKGLIRDSHSSPRGTWELI